MRHAIIQDTTGNPVNYNFSLYSSFMLCEAIIRTRKITGLGLCLCVLWSGGNGLFAEPDVCRGYCGVYCGFCDMCSGYCGLLQSVRLFFSL